MSIIHTEPAPGYPVMEIRHQAATARVALHGAHLMEWSPAGQKPVLYLSPRAVYREGKALRGGVPLCWPWFGPHADDPSLPAHGFARTRFWELLDTAEDPGGVRLRFRLTDDAATRRLWPHAFRLIMEMRIGAELHLALHMENTGTEGFTVTGALHSYFTAGDIRQVTIEGLDGVEYLDETGLKTVRRQSGDIVFRGEVDRDYATNGEVRIREPGRTVSVKGSGSGCTVVWNPWIEKTQSMSDLPGGAWQHFVCVETAHAWRDRITLAPGGRHTLAATIRVV